MRQLYIPRKQKDWEGFFRSGQHGGSLVGFRGSRFPQRGAGLGSIFSSLFRSILPVAKSVGKAVGRQALSTGAEAAADTLAGRRSFGDALELRGRQGASKLIKKGIRKMKRRKPQKGRGRTLVKKRKPRRRRRRVQRGRGLGTRPKGITIKAIKKRKKGKRKYSDQLGTYFT